jgi:hypothetical protein
MLTLWAAFSDVALKELMEFVETPVLLIVPDVIALDWRLADTR